MSYAPEAAVPLAPLTTLGVGGRARHFWRARDVAAVRAAVDWAGERALPLVALGGGSNMLVSDRGIDGLVLRVEIAEFSAKPRTGEALVTAGAGRAFDELCAWTVSRGYAGIECLSGIPGEVGAAPMQNIGAYGQEVAAVIERVCAVDRTTGAEIELTREACAFSYRDSLFKRQAERYLVTSVAFRFAAAPPTIAYAELDRAMQGRARNLAEVRRAVLDLRRAKSMVLDAESRDDENRRSAGSFFVNPTVTAAEADAIAARAGAGAAEMPRFARPVAAAAPAAAGEGSNRCVKLSAAWLIERAGLPKGTRRGPVGLSTRHALAIVNFGGATAAQIVRFAGEVRARVRERFGVCLAPEPRLYGFTAEEIASLSAD